KTYQNSGNFITYLSVNGDSPDLILEGIAQYNLQNNFNRAEISRVRATQAGNGLLVFYLISLAHVVITGASEESDQTFFIESIPEFWMNEIGTKYSAGYTKRF